ncbi:alkylmercury lyase MerB [bacterium]|nr:alkylmercury lyase MerB [bacterium]
MNTNDKIFQLISAFPKEFTELSEDEQRVSVVLYRLLARGEPVSHESIAAAIQMPPNTVDSILGRWPGIYYDGEHRIIGYWGLALPKMSHRFEVNGRTLYTWCAWDSLFIPEILQQTAQVESHCPVTGDAIQLTVTPQSTTGLQPAGVVMSFLTPQENKIRENIILNFCHYVHFFSSRNAGMEWTSKNEGTLLMSLNEAFDLAKRKNSLQYHTVLQSLTN